MGLGLCLSGGGIKGVAHIGVLQALQDNNISITHISGTSSGSIVATLYAIGYTPLEIYNFFKKYSREITKISYKKILKLIYGLLFKHKVIIDGLNSGKKLEKIVYEACADKNIYFINEIKFPLLIPSVNVQNGKTYIFTSQEKRNTYQDNCIYNSSISISKAIRASCSYPGIYCPCYHKGIPLVDGGIRYNIPWAETKKLGCDTVLSVIFEKNLKSDSFLDIFEIIIKSINILSHELSLCSQIGADYILKINTDDVTLLDTSKIDFLYEIGYKSADNFIKNHKL